MYLCIQVSPMCRKRCKLRLDSLSAGWRMILVGKTLALAIIQNVQKLAGGKNSKSNNGDARRYVGVSLFLFVGFLQVP